MQVAQQKLAREGQSDFSLASFAEKARQVLLDFFKSGHDLACISQHLESHPLFAIEALFLAPALPTDGTPYSRRVVYSGIEGEAMLARWPAGAICWPHDHGQSKGVVTVLRGKFYEQSYRVANGLEPVGAPEFYEDGALMPVAPGDIHRMRAMEEGVTLHLYTPAIHAMKVYDHNTILTVADSCGAWIPHDPSLILHREPIGGDSLHHEIS